MASLRPWLSVCFFFLMIRRPPRSTLDRSSAASDVYKRQAGVSGESVSAEGVERVAPDPVREDDVIRETGGEGGHAPVSYTHLRAHETVLDLVCRLLLEKKKNKRNESDIRIIKQYIQIRPNDRPRDTYIDYNTRVK